MIEVEDLTKHYGELRAVDRISFQVHEGEIYGLLGPNGAGKTTTLSMLAGLLAPDSGRIRFEGIDLSENPLEVKRRLGVVPQEVALYEELTGRENLSFWGGLYGMSGALLRKAVDRVLEQVGLDQRADEPVRKYSGGMKRRLNLSLGLVHSPKIVMMDEPTVGIDPQARANILEVVERIAEAGTTVLYTTHYLEEAERFCSRIGIMDHGRILAEGSLDALKREYGEGEVITVRGRFEEETTRDVLADIDGLTPVHIDDQRVVLTAGTGDRRGAVTALSRLLDGPLEIEGVSIEPPSLNGLFLRLTGRELRD